MASICCKAETRVGYYNADQRPDIHGGLNMFNSKFGVIGIMGTYCTNCSQLCDYCDDEGNEYFTNGTRKEVKQIFTVDL